MSNASVEVSNNGADFMSGAARFMYVGGGEGWQIKPTWGPAGGTTTVTVTGRGLGAAGEGGVWCRFGAMAVEGRGDGAGGVRCETPVQGEGVNAYTVMTGRHRNDHQ